jgi:hypothetical protein
MHDYGSPVPKSICSRSHCDGTAPVSMMRISAFRRMTKLPMSVSVSALCAECAAFERASYNFETDLNSFNRSGPAGLRYAAMCAEIRKRNSVRDGANSCSSAPHAVSTAEAGRLRTVQASAARRTRFRSGILASRLAVRGHTERTHSKSLAVNTASVCPAGASIRGSISNGRNTGSRSDMAASLNG